MPIESSEVEEYRPPPEPPEPPVQESRSQRLADEFDAATGQDVERADAGKAEEIPEHTREQNYERLDNILARPDVIESTAELERYSQLGDPKNQHIEGAFIVEDAKTGQVRLERVEPPGTADNIDWPQKAQLGDSERVIGLYHTQPVSESGEYGDRGLPTPTDQDRQTANSYDVPGVVANEYGHYRYL